MKVFDEVYPFSPKSGRVVNETSTERIERYYQKADFEGRSFDIVFEVSGGKDVSFNIVYTG
ncbi:MAG: hypothetical protein LBD27_04840 [Tannerella sp.]|jgi:hypothetical protein|nr:hypothetical protein [Tannerella sp.]